MPCAGGAIFFAVFHLLFLQFRSAYRAEVQVECSMRHCPDVLPAPLVSMHQSRLIHRFFSLSPVYFTLVHLFHAGQKLAKITVLFILVHSRSSQFQQESSGVVLGLFSRSLKHVVSRKCHLQNSQLLCMMIFAPHSGQCLNVYS